MLIKSKKLNEHIQTPKVLFTEDSSDQKVFNYFLDDITLYSKMIHTANGFLHQTKGDQELKGLLDAILFLININRSKTIDTRELDHYLRDDVKTASFTERNIIVMNFIQELQKFLLDYDYKSEASFVFTDAKVGERLSYIKDLFEANYNSVHSAHNKHVELIDLDDDVVVVNLVGVSDCSMDKELEYLQNMLQDKLNYSEINVILEF